MPDFSDHQYTLERLTDAQDANKDQREAAREAKLFVTKRNGQWEPYWWDAQSGQPRYTFDLTSPVIAGISGEIKKADFDIRVSPAGGEASKEDAKVLDGLIRNIENISNATKVFNRAAKSMIIGGIDGWRVNTRFIDDNSFDQDIVIEAIADFASRAWLDVGAQEQDGSDAKWGFVLQAIPKLDYEKKWPEGSGQSIGDDKQSHAYWQRADVVVVGELLYIKEIDREIVQMDNGAVYTVDDDYESIKAELEALGVTEKRRRKRADNVVFSHKFDGGDWLEPEVKTVFSFVPIIPTYGNFDVIEDKLIYEGKVEKLLDPQRVYNYAKSREVSEGALAPRPKYWMTEAQAAGHEDTLATMNTNADPVQFYNPDGEAGIPQQSGGAVINPGLLATSQSMQEVMVRVGGQTAPGMGEQINNQSGVAVKALQAKGDIGSIDYFEAQEIAICHTARIIIDAIPKVYDTERQVRILGEDGSTSMVTLNETVIDQETQQPVTLKDLSKGTYDVVCSSGPSFQNRQQETVAAFIEAASIVPEIGQIGSDIFVNNITAPGMQDIAERLREQKFEQGLIPEDQLTEDEKEQQAAAAQQPPQPDALMVAAQAEQAKADVAGAKVQVEAERNQLQAQKQRQEFAISVDKQELARDRDEFELQKTQFQLQIEQDKVELKAVNEFNQQQRDAISQALNDNKTEAETLKIIREAMGVETIVGPSNTEAYINQAENVEENTER